MTWQKRSAANDPIPPARDSKAAAELWRVAAKVVYYNMFPAPGKSDGGASEHATDADGKRIYDEVGLPALVIGFGTFIGCMWVAGSMPELPPLAMFWLSLAPMHLAAAGTVIVLVRLREPSGGGLCALGLSRPVTVGIRELLASAAGTLLLLYPAILAVKALTTALMSLVGHVPRSSPLVSLLFEQRSGVFWWSTGFAIVVLAPFAEEILFRLVLFEVVNRRDSRLAAVVSSLAFAIAHQLPEELPALFLLGMVLQRAREKHQSLWLPIAIHTGFNAASLALVVLVRCLGWAVPT